MTRVPGVLRRTPPRPPRLRSPAWRCGSVVRVRVSDPHGSDAREPGPSSGSTPTGAVAETTAQRAARDAGESTTRTAGLVLVVDDNTGFRGLAARILTGWGYEVIEAASVADAVTAVVERRPRTVLVDIGLPDGDGFGLTQQLVALSSPPRVVLISTDADAGNRSAAFRAGAVGFLPKDELLGGALPGLIEG